MTAGYRWVACSRDANPVFAVYRHLLPDIAGPMRSQGDTFCGASGVGDGVWRGNTHKPKCVRCAKAQS